VLWPARLTHQREMKLAAAKAMAGLITDEELNPNTSCLGFDRRSPKPSLGSGKTPPIEPGWRAGTTGPDRISA